MFLKGYRFFGGPYRFTRFCCIWHHHEILVCSYRKNCVKEAMDITDKEDGIVFLWYWKNGTAEGSFTAKKWFGPPWVTSWSGGCNELACGCLQNADEAKMQTRCHRMFVGMLRTGFGLVNIDDMCLRPFRARILSKWLSVGFSVGPVGLSVFSPEISEITGFGWYIHASDFPPNSQTWWDLEPAKMGSKCFMLKVMYWKVIVLFWGGPISVYSVACMSNVIFNPSLLNWSSLILTVAHMETKRGWRFGSDEVPFPFGWFLGCLAVNFPGWFCDFFHPNPRGAMKLHQNHDTSYDLLVSPPDPFCCLP